MKKGYILGAVGLVLLGLGTSACSNQADNGGNKQATSKNAKKLEKELRNAEKNSNQESSNKFVGNTLKTETGSVTIKKLTNVTLKNATSDGDVNYVIVEASFTNKAKKGVTPEDFFNDNLKVEQKLSDSSHELGSDRSAFEEDLTPWKDQIDAKLNKVDPGKTVDFAMSYQIDKDNGDKVGVNTYLFQPFDSDTENTMGKALTLKVSSSQVITASSDTDDSDGADN